MSERLSLDVGANRRSRKYSDRELALRILWALVRPAFSLSPRFIHGWRPFVLRMVGARVGSEVQVDPSVEIFAPWALEIGDQSSIGHGATLYNLGPIKIGRQATISQGAHLCAGTHDYTRADFPLLKPPIVVGDQAWICADAFVGPGVSVGEGAVVAARAVVVRDVPPWTVVAGNPARFIKERGLRPAADPEARS